MSRGREGRTAAWEAWSVFFTVGGQAPYAFEHQCGSVGRIGDDLSTVVCPGCSFEIARPEIECEPLYAAKHKAHTP